MPENSYYLLKIKGKAKIPDYIQLRDSTFTLIGYFRPERPTKLEKLVEDENIRMEILEIIEKMPYGKITEVKNERI